MTWRGILSAVLAAVAAIALIVFMRPISEWVANLFIDNPTEVATVVGHLEQVDGKVEKRDNQNAAWIAAKGGDPIKQSERVRVGAGNHLILRLNSQHSLGIQGPAEFIVERWSPGQADSPYLLSMIRGDFSLHAPGKPGQLFVLHDKKVFPVEAKPQAYDPRTVEIVKQPELPTLEISPATTKKDPEPLRRKETKERVGQKLPEKVPEEESLSNKYIESVLARLSSEFRRCQMNSLRDRRNSKGSLLLSLTIEPSGQVDNVYVLQESDLDRQLVNCAVSVVSRAKFRSFDGLPISLSYPIDFR